MLTVQLTDADYVAAQRLHTGRARWIPLIFDGVLIALGLLAWTGAFGREFREGAVVFVPVMAIILLLTIVAQYTITPRLWLRNFREQKTAHNPITYSWNDAALTAQTNYGTSVLPWTDFLKTREDDQVFLLYLARTLFHCIPKRAFATPAQAAEFGALIKARIGRSA